MLHASQDMKRDTLWHPRRLVLLIPWDVQPMKPKSSCLSKLLWKSDRRCGQNCLLGDPKSHQTDRLIITLLFLTEHNLEN